MQLICLKPVFEVPPEFRPGTLILIPDLGSESGSLPFALPEVIASAARVGGERP